MNNPKPFPIPAADSGNQPDEVLPNGEVLMYGQDPEQVRVGASPRGWDDDTLGGESDDR